MNHHWLARKKTTGATTMKHVTMQKGNKKPGRRGDGDRAAEEHY